MLSCLAAQGPASTSVPLSAAAKGMTSFVSVPVSQEELSRSTSNTHPSYVALQQFLEQLSKVGSMVSTALQGQLTQLQLCTPWGLLVQSREKTLSR